MKTNWLTVHLSLIMLCSILFMNTSSVKASDRIPRPETWGDFYVYQMDNGNIRIRFLASNDKRCNDVWDYLYLKYVTDDGVARNLLFMDDKSCAGCSVTKDPNDNIYHYYKGLNGNDIRRTRYEDLDGGDFYLEFTWYNPPSNLRRENNFYLNGLWRACWDDWIGDWRYQNQNNSPWKRTCYLLDGGMENKFDPTKKKDIQRYWAPRVFHDTRDDEFKIQYIFTVYKYRFYWQQEIFGPANFDGDWNAKNNWESNAHSKIVPKSYAYSSFVETSTHYYLGYQFFHPTDDAELIAEDRHENDLEDVYICIKKGSANGGFGTFVGMATQQHGDYDVHRKSDVKFSGGHHPQIYITSNGIGIGGGWSRDHGHSIYKYNGTYQRDFTDFGAKDGIVFNISDKADHVAANPAAKGSLWYVHGISITYPIQAYYDVLDIDEIWSLRETRNHNPFMDKYGAFGGEGSDGKGPGAHAPWTDNDKVFSRPAEFFNSRLGLGASTNYIYNPYYRGHEVNGRGPEVDRAKRGNLPSGWTEKAISSNRSISYYRHKDLTISGKGTSANDFHFYYRNAPASSGKVQMIAKVDRLRENISSSTEAGIRVSTGTSYYNPFVAVYKRPNGSTILRYRSTQSGSITTKYGPTNASFKYLRVNRSGNSWYAYASSNKKNWTYIGSGTMNVSDVKMGVYLDPNSYSLKASASFTDIAYTLTPHYNPPSTGGGGSGGGTGGGGSGGGGSGGGGGGPIDEPIDVDGPIDGDGFRDPGMKTTLFPNPVKGYAFNLFIEKSSSEDDVQVAIYSLKGEELYSETFSNVYGAVTIQVRDLGLKSGVYLVETTSGDNKSSNKLIIE